MGSNFHRKLPDGLTLVKVWMADEDSKNWRGMRESRNSSYIDVWMDWMGYLSSISIVVGKETTYKQWFQATPIDVMGFLAPRPGQYSRHNPTKRLSKVTRFRYWSLLKRIYAFALEEGWVAENPALLDWGDRPSVQDGDSIVLPASLWRALPGHLPAPDAYQSSRDNAILRLLYDMALTPEEVRQLTWAELEESPGVVWSPAITTVPKFISITGYRTAQDRTLSLTPLAAKALAIWHEFSRNQRGLGVVASDHVVFYSKRMGPLSPRMLFHVVAQVIHQAYEAMPDDGQKPKLLRVGPQVLRNTAIYQHYRAGMPEREILARMGMADRNSLRRIRRLAT